MRATWSLLLVTLCLSCSTVPLDGGPASPVRLDIPEAVGWEPGGPFPLELTVYNASGHRLLLTQPRPEAVQVKVFRASDGGLACRTPSPSRTTAESWDAKAVLASQGLRVKLDLWPYCRRLGEGVYRYELVYAANAAATSEPVFTGLLGPRSGKIAVGTGLSTDEAALAAALAQPTAPSPAAAGVPSQPAAPGAAAETAASQPAAPGAGAAAAPPAQSAESVKACLDRELAARGLNAYGDPQGTTYADGPPADEGGRVLYVAGRNPEIRAACHVQGF